MGNSSGLVTEVILVVVGYAVGCFSAGYYLVRFRTGQDIRAIESGSTGSTNVRRVLGWPGFAATMLCDTAKGFMAVWAGVHFRLSPWGIALVMIAVMLGHIWPLQLGFRGGKGLATGLGVLVALDYRLALIVGGAALLGLLLRIGTASFLAGALASPIVAVFLGHPLAEVAGLATMVGLVVIAHKNNIRAFFAAGRGRKGLQA